jgi:CBS-domain-containing membrane protein
MARGVREVMSRRVVTVRSDASVASAVERMRRFGFSALPVVNARHRLVGVVSLLDVLRNRESGGTDAGTHVDEIMNPDVLSMPPTAGAAVVAKRMRSHGELRVMPIVERGELIGVVTRSDLLRPPASSNRFGSLLRRLTGRDSADSADEALLRLARPGRERPAAVAAASVREVMTTEVVTVAPSDPVGVAVALVLERRFTALPVVDPDRRLVGIVSEADLLGDRYSGRSGARTVSAVMTRTPVTLAASATVGEAVSLIAERGLRVVPVVSEGIVVGVVGRGDLI